MKKYISVSQTYKISSFKTRWYKFKQEYKTCHVAVWCSSFTAARWTCSILCEFVGRSASRSARVYWRKWMMPLYRRDCSYWRSTSQFGSRLNVLCLNLRFNGSCVVAHQRAWNGWFSCLAVKWLYERLNTRRRLLLLSTRFVWTLWNFFFFLIMQNTILISS